MEIEEQNRRVSEEKAKNEEIRLEAERQQREIELHEQQKHQKADLFRQQKIWQKFK